MKRNIRGFNYDNCLRNAEMLKSGFEPKQPFTSGTTIVGLHFDDGIMIGTDSRATNSDMVNSCNSQKIRRLHDNICCGGSGIAGDLDNIVGLVRGQLEMHHTSTGSRQVPVVCAKKLVKAAVVQGKGQIYASFLIGGVDSVGCYLSSVHVDGTSEVAEYLSLGSGQFGSMGILEDRWHPDMDEDEARELIADAVSAGINNDLHSGSSIEVCIMHKDLRVELCSEPIHFNLRDTRTEQQHIRHGTTDVNFTFIHKLWTDKIEQFLPATLQKLEVDLRHPIRRHEIHGALGQTRLEFKRRSDADNDDDSPPHKMRRI